MWALLGPAGARLCQFGKINPQMRISGDVVKLFYVTPLFLGAGRNCSFIFYFMFFEAQTEIVILF
jgi:hypothetical protein